MIEIKNQEQFESYKKLYNLKKLPPQFIRGKVCEFYMAENGTIYYKKRQKKYNEDYKTPYETRNGMSNIKEAFKRNILNLYSTALKDHTCEEMQIAITRTQHHQIKIKQLLQKKFQTEEERIDAAQNIIDSLFNEVLDEFAEIRPGSKSIIITTILSSLEIDNNLKNSILKEFLISKIYEIEVEQENE